MTSTPTRSVRRRFMWAFIAAAAVPLAFTILVVYNANRTALRDANRELLISVLEDISSLVDVTVSVATVETTQSANLLATASLTTEQRIELLRKYIDTSSVVDSLAIYDDKGVLIDVISQADTSVNYPRTLPLEQQQSWQPYIVAGLSDETRIWIAAPVEGSSGAKWRICSAISMLAVEERVREIMLTRFEGDANALLLMDARGNVIDRLASKVPLAQREAIAASLLTDDKFERELLEFRESSPLGKAYVSAVRSLPSAGLAVIASIRKDKAYASLYALQRFLLVAFAVAIVLAVVLGVLTTGRLAKPILELVAYARALAERRFDNRERIANPDELGVLANAMADSAEALALSERNLVQETKLRSSLSRFIPSGVVDRIVSDPKALELGGEKRRITVMFVDVASFTPLAERLGPQDVVALLNQLFLILTKIVFLHGGTVDKFIGDRMMAMWGAPQPCADSAARALASASEMLRWIEAANEVWHARFGVRLYVSIGVHSGDAVVGNLGTAERMEYTAIGDTVNVAAHLEDMARPQQILLSGATKDETGSDEFLHVGTRRLPGRQERIEIFELRWT